MKNITKIFIFAFSLIFASMGFAQVPYNTGYEGGPSEPFQSGYGTSTIQTTIKYAGTYGLESAGVGTGGKIIGCESGGLYTAVCSIADAYIIERVYFASLPTATTTTFLSPLNTGGGPKLYIKIRSDGKIQVTDWLNNAVATGSSTLLTGQWYKFSINTKFGNGVAYEIKIDDAVELTGTADQGAANYGLMSVGKSNASDAVIYYDDHELYSGGFPTPTPTATATPTITPTSSGFPCKISLVGVCN